MTTTTDLHSYVLPRGRQPPVIIDNVINDELGQELLGRLNETFRGRRGLEDTHQYQPDEPLKFSNTPRVLFYNQVVREATNGGIHVLSPAEAVQHWETLPERSSTYADTDSVVVFPQEGPNEQHRQTVLGLVDAQGLSTKVPLVVAGLTVEPADTEHGFAFAGTDYMTVAEAPFLTKDQKVKYDPEQGIVPAEEGVQLWTPSSQSSLRRFFRNGDGLSVYEDYLLGANGYGRVQVAQAPKGRSDKTLEATVQ